MEFCYGHRLLRHRGKCRFLHGHNGLLEVDLEAEALDDMGMVVDFGDIDRVVRQWVDDHLDHKLLLCSEDPLVPVLQEAGEALYVMEGNPTAENIAALVWSAARQAGLPVREVRLWETSRSRACYRGQ
jgi:6-pyruvoyltetrahydropterin/6-carboxytetrahydropterin synthase